ncbi:MAG: DnaJ domain-containing protein [Dongiaceae bacterium]
MPAYLALGVLVAVLLLLLGRGFVAADPRDVARGLRWAGMALAAVLGLALLRTERFGLLHMLGAMAAPLMRSWRHRRSAARAAGGPPPPRGGDSSSIDSAFLHMELDHGSGAMSGRVLAGRFAGRSLADLAFAELLELRQACAGDPASLALLEAYLDRTQPADWRERAEAAARPEAPAAGSGMTRERAYQVLGLAPGADPAAIRAAHRRLMMKNHPDHGGSAYIAAEINRARDLLLG